MERVNKLYRNRICNDTRFVKYCEALTNYERIGIDWCKCLPGRYCRNGVLINDTMVARWDIYQEISVMEYEDYEGLLQTFKEFFTYCNLYQASENELFEDCNLTYHQHVRCPTEEPVVPACWTLNTIVGRPYGETQKVLSGARFTLTVTPHEEEYSTEYKSVMAALAIHSPRQIVNPFIQGFAMDINTRQDFRLKKTVKKLLPAPYETNCFDYIEQWEGRGGYGPTNQKECIDECKKNTSLKVYDGCITPYFTIPGNERRCTIDKYPTPAMVKESADCEFQCKPACYEEIYEVTRNIKDEQSGTDCSADEFKSHKLREITMFIYMNGMETTTYTYSPKYQNIETFSYLGGYVGMWLGISLVAVFDFLETVVIMMRYPFRKLQQSKAKRDKLEHIKKLQRDL